MANPFGRNGRRRRVLSEEMLSASSAHLALRATAADENDADAAPRYSEAAGVEHHPQITSFVPRRFRTIAVLALAGGLSTAAVEALHWFVAPQARNYGAGGLNPFELGTPGNVAAWLSAVLLLVAAAVALLIYSLRRHRINDYRGRYRVWLAAAVACTLLSVNSVAALHVLVAAVAAQHTGWTALPDHAIWWLAVGGLPLAWISIRAWLDARESRLAAAALSVAFASYAAGVVGTLGGWPAVGAQVQPMYTAGAHLIGHWMLLIGLISYSRYLVLDAQGLIPARRARKPLQSKEKVQEKTDMGQRPIRTGRATDGRKTDNSVDSNAAAYRQAPATDSRKPADQIDRSRWTDGSEPDSEDYGGDDDGPRDRKLTKAQRKRLRKLKANHRAA
jgi:hypothetical protein